MAIIKEKNSKRSPKGKSPRKRDANDKVSAEEKENTEIVVHINRCAKVVKGGRRFSFSALVVVGDCEGTVGVGLGKAKEVPDAIRKGTEAAYRNMRRVELKNTTIPHEVLAKSGGAKIILRPASPGTGVIAGGAARAVLEAAGITDILSKSLGSNTPRSVVSATIEALAALRTAEQYHNMRS